MLLHAEELRLRKEVEVEVERLLGGREVEVEVDSEVE